MFSFLYGGKLGEMLAPTKSPDEMLYSACRDGRAAKVEELLEAGANAQYRDGAGCSLVHAACRSGSAALVGRLIGLGVDVRAAARDGTTALHVASESGAEDVVAVLIEKGADPLAKDGRGRTPHALCTSYALKKILLRHMFPSQDWESAGIQAPGAVPPTPAGFAGDAAAMAMAALPPPSVSTETAAGGAPPVAGGEAPPTIASAGAPARSRYQADGFKTTVGDRALAVSFGNNATPSSVGGWSAAPPPTGAGGAAWAAQSQSAPARGAAPRGYAAFSNPYDQSGAPAKVIASGAPTTRALRDRAPARCSSVRYSFVSNSTLELLARRPPAHARSSLTPSASRRCPPPPHTHTLTTRSAPRSQARTAPSIWTPAKQVSSAASVAAGFDAAAPAPAVAAAPAHNARLASAAAAAALVQQAPQLPPPPQQSVPLTDVSFDEVSLHTPTTEHDSTSMFG